MLNKFRRSGKSTNSQELRSPPVHVPEKDAIAIQPPKKVIRALYDYTVENPQQNSQLLSFTAGDFLHVVARENDPDWYEACNPLQFTRGLVPVSYFEEVGKQQIQKNFSQQSTSRSSTTGGHDSGYSEKNSEVGTPNGHGAAIHGQGHGRMRSAAGKGNGAVIYGMVLYDFNAERSDELDAKAGEPIVVVAQSNSEWFVAKPITRLGGPGLIPVSFIEIRDAASGQTLDPLEAVRKAGVPKVEEWKKAAAEYKNSSIPLGRLDSSQGTPLHQSMERLSVASSARPSNDTGRHGSDARQQQGIGGPGRQEPRNSAQSIAPVRARVPGFGCHSGEFWFNVEAKMEDGTIWNLERHYKDFYALQLALMEAFPEAAGKVEGVPRTLPFMPGPVPFVSESLTQQRQEHFDVYMQTLLRISTAITNCPPVRHFFMPRAGDTKISAEESGSGYRQSISSRHSGLADSRHSSVSAAANGALSPLRPQMSRQSMENHAPPGHLPPTQYHKPMPASLTQQHSYQHLGLPPHSASPPPMLRSGSALSVATDISGTSNMYPPGAASAVAKVKVWFGDTDCVVVRLPQTYNFSDLMTKLRERRAHEQIDGSTDGEAVKLLVEWKDEGTGAFWPITSDDELLEARRRCEPKLSLRVTAAEEGNPFA